MTPVEDFARRLKALRKSRDMTQDDLAKAAKLSRGYLSRIEIGMQEPTLSAIEKLAAALEMEPALLLEYKGERRAGRKKP